jgi:hypothetical protein
MTGIPPLVSRRPNAVDTASAIGMRFQQLSRSAHSRHSQVHRLSSRRTHSGRCLQSRLRSAPAVLLLFAGLLLASSCSHPATSSRPALPFGSVDVPSAKAVVQGPIQVAGWALAEAPITAVSLYLDRAYVGEASLRLPRPDVAGAKPGYKDAANSGWTMTLNTSTLESGWHELIVQARSENGATRDLATLPIFVKH